MTDAAIPSGPAALPLAFVRREGVILRDAATDAPRVIAREGVMPHALQEVRRVLGRPFAVESCSNADFMKLVEQHYGDASAGDVAEGLDGMDIEVLGKGAVTDLLDDDKQAPVTNLINTLFRQALRQRASDMHVEPQEKGLRVRMRIDGVLQSVLERKEAPTAMVVSRLKVMAGLDIAEARRPQDGRIALRFGDREVDVRVSTIPSKHGERVVLRILDKSTGLLSLTAIGLDAAQHDAIVKMTSVQNGLVLVTGPTGSGKTTTLYAVIDHLNQIGSNILTVEDPVEYDLAGVGQTQVNSKIDMSFASALRAILRQDPDIVLVGEIRDGETAGVAMQAALTGHLVLSTLHASTALGAVTRLRDLGVEPFLIASTLRGTIAQRLVRVLCDKCKAGVPIVPAAAALFERHDLEVPQTIAEARGCDACAKIGYAGRTALYEIVQSTAALRDLIHTDASEADLTSAALRPDQTLLASGLRAVATGTTALEEVLRVVNETG